ncbi:MAG: class I SAM-dependent methyltransferase [Acidobacteria bacterium]|nr:class I SAM-dependent methyltransferase [Acidobacteriota bacterium]
MSSRIASVHDPLAGSAWSAPNTVAGFQRSPPNEVLMAYATRIRGTRTAVRALDIGCGAARNAVPLAEAGWSVVGVDLSWPMLVAAQERARAHHVASQIPVVLAPADRLPVASASCDLVIAHGIWNLLPTAGLFRSAVAEAARAAKPGASLFVFTFSRSTIPEDAAPVSGEPFVFTQFSGRPQCFLTYPQLVDELGAVGFAPDPTLPVSEYNRRSAGAIVGGPPVIWEAAFVRQV